MIERLEPVYEKSFYVKKKERWKHGRAGPHGGKLWWGDDPVDEFTDAITDASNYLDVAYSNGEVSYEIFKFASNALYQMYMMGVVCEKVPGTLERIQRMEEGSSKEHGCGSGFPINAEHY